MAGSWASAKLSEQTLLELGRHRPTPASRWTAALGAGQSRGRHTPSLSAYRRCRRLYFLTPGKQGIQLKLKRRKGNY